MMNKKTLFALLISAFACLTTTAQNYKSFPANSGKDDGNAITYCLPKTDLVIKFKVEKTVRTKGIYSDQAYLLGIDNAALKNNSSYRIINADICEKTSADNQKSYLLFADNKTVVEKTPYGTIKSVTGKGQNASKYVGNNAIQTCQSAQDVQMNANTAPKTVSLPVRSTYETRLMQQGLLTRYPQMSAEKTVAEIKRLREKQIEILSGSVEGTFMNTTIDYMYKQLDEIINSYVSLFTGVETVSEEEFSFVITPEKPIILEEDLLIPVCKFSQTSGLNDLNSSVEGTKIIARIHSYVTTEQNAKDVQVNGLSEMTKRKADKNGVGLYYCIPQSAKVSLEGVNMNNSSKVVKLLQYGVVSCINDQNANIVFDENTGEILRMW